MSSGDFETAWMINDGERQCWPSAHQLWNGEPVEHAAITLEARHGLGDAVQMMRFVPTLNHLGCTVTINLPTVLQPLAAYFNGNFKTNVLRERQGTPASLEMMELPYALRLQPSHLPVSKNYLQLPPELTARASSQMRPSGELPRVGMVWSGSSWDPERWIPFDQLQPLLDMPCCSWWNMQGGAAAVSHRHPRLHKLRTEGQGSLVELAAAIQSVDLLITVDTLAAHIAGALGKPVWVLLKKKADWRWMHNRSTSPWYPSVRLFRQGVCGDWTGVISAVQAELERRFQTHHPGTMMPGSREGKPMPATTACPVMQGA